MNAATGAEGRHRCCRMKNIIEMRTDHDVEFERFCCQGEKEVEALRAAIRIVRGFKRTPPKMQEHFHITAMAALRRAIGDVVVNIDSASHKLAIEEGLKFISEVLQEADEQAAKRESNPASHLH